MTPITFYLSGVDIAGDAPHKSNFLARWDGLWSTKNPRVVHYLRMASHKLVQWFQVGKFLALAGAILAIIVAGTFVVRSTSDAADSPKVDRIELESKEPISFNGDLATIDARLRDSSTPFAVSVFGDATGNESTEWVYLVAEQVSEKYSRPVTIHNWLMGSNYYSSKAEIGSERPGRTVEIWNGSASGESADYSNAYFGQLSPVDPDLVFVSHAHNALSVIAQQNGLARLNQNIDRWNNPRPVVVFVLQNPRLDSRAALQQDLVTAARLVANKVGAAVVDVNLAFGSDFSGLLNPDGFNPNDAGQQVWADAVEQALGLS